LLVALKDYKNFVKQGQTLCSCGGFMVKEIKLRYGFSNECRNAFHESGEEGDRSADSLKDFSRCSRDHIAQTASQRIGQQRSLKMKKMPSRDTSGKCRGACRDRVKEGTKDRQKMIASEAYSTPIPNSPAWTLGRNDTPGVWDGHGL
jgi:hypothetical protein